MGNQHSNQPTKIGVKSPPARFIDDVSSKNSRTNWIAGECRKNRGVGIGQDEGLLSHPYFKIIALKEGCSPTDKTQLRFKKNSVKLPILNVP